MRSALKLFSVLTLIALSACASYGNWRPVVDTGQDKNLNSLEKDYQDCKVLADQAADASGTTAERGLWGALAGAATGAAVGAIAGDAGIGAAIGATTGVAGGVASGAVSGEEAYKSAYASCMRNRGHPVIQ